jgi:hypothetical protein
MSSTVSVALYTMQYLRSHTDVTSTEVDGLLGSVPFCHLGGDVCFVGSDEEDRDGGIDESI